eukprot:1969049-Rhodomonas_salina.1
MSESEFSVIDEGQRQTCNWHWQLETMKAVRVELGRVLRKLRNQPLLAPRCEGGDGAQGSHAL